MKLILTVFFIFYYLRSTTNGQSAPDSNNDNSGAFSNFRTCFQSALLGFRDIAETDFISLLKENFEREGIHNISSTSKIPTELGSSPPEIPTAGQILGAILKDSKECKAPPATATKATPREEIRYLLFTNRNKEQFQVMPEDGSVKGTYWNPKKKTKVLVHGLTSTQWNSAITNIWTQHIFEIKDAYVNRKQGPGQGFNVIVVDWTSLSTVTLSRYPEAARGTKVAGDDLAQFLIRLRKANNILSWDDVHILGHSLGAHVAGFTGSNIKRISKGNMVARITGLDPAGLCFDTPTGIIENPSDILDSSDAKFVDIIHTNMGNLIRTGVGRYGSSMQTGHADFYPNGGEVQGGCNFMEDRLMYCSHQKSVVYYAKSITERIITCPCKDWDSYRSLNCDCNLKSGGQYFGEFSDPMARGKYFLEITS